MDLPQSAMIASAAGGAVIVAGVSVDVGRTVLDPAGRGLLTRAAHVASLRMARRVPALRRLLGPLAIITSFTLWVAGLWLGWALLFFAFRDHLAAPSSPPSGGLGFGDVLYFSGVALTTLGFGDVVPGTLPLRLATVGEAITGLAVITAAITYLLSSYSATTALRSAAAGATDRRLDELEGAAAFVVHGRAGGIADLQGTLLTTEQHLRRFPVLYYFHASDPRRSVLSLLRAAALVVLVARWGVASGDDPARDLVARGLQETLAHVIGVLCQDFPGLLDAPRAARVDDTEAPRERLLEAVSAAGGRPSATAPEDDGLRDLLDAAERALGRVAAAHGYDDAPLLSPAA